MVGWIFEHHQHRRDATRLRRLPCGVEELADPSNCLSAVSWLLNLSGSRSTLEMSAWRVNTQPPMKLLCTGASREFVDSAGTGRRGTLEGTD